MSFDSELWLRDDDTTAYTRHDSRIFEGHDHHYLAQCWLDDMGCWCTKVYDLRVSQHPDVIEEIAA